MFFIHDLDLGPIEQVADPDLELRITCTPVRSEIPSTHIFPKQSNTLIQVVGGCGEPILQDRRCKNLLESDVLWDKIIITSLRSSLYSPGTSETIRNHTQSICFFSTTT